MAIIFSYADRKLNLSYKRLLKQWLQRVAAEESVDIATLNYIFCSDDFLLDINQRFLHHDFYTDIITFDLTEAVTAGIVGEIYISLDRVKDNAILNSVDFPTELKRVMVHGLLHLCGYKDKTKREIAQMRDKEDRYLRLFSKVFS